MADRKKLSDRIRFEVLKRDKFTCQYCGKKAPDVILAVDHINPVSKGGGNGLLNLTTSCWDCNSGKSDKLLSDDSAVEKARHQAEMIEERRAQVRLMATWQVELAKMDPEIDAINEALFQITGSTLTDTGKRSMRKMVREFSIQEIIEAIAISWDQYSPEEAFSHIHGIARNRKQRREDPELADIHRVLNSVGKKLAGPSWKRRDALAILLRIRDEGGDWLAISRRAEANCNYWSTYIERLNGAEN